MASNELRNKTELTSVTGDEWVYVQDNLTTFEVKKISITRVPIKNILYLVGCSAGIILL